MFGIGASLTTVGLSVWAADFSCAERRAQSVQRFQLCYAIGGLAFSFMPGMVADLTGSYAPAYVIFALFGVFFDSDRPVDLPARKQSPNLNARAIFLKL